ncbi:MAG: DNA gyrase inhibitor YacG [Polyangiaceae bacterium]|nr:DNA gyrase inhibitor YacG [Polyangiaceae bacterium]
MARCPICTADAKTRATNGAFPFCSPRCRTIDLGKWLNEEYRVAENHTDDPSSAAPATNDDAEDDSSSSQQQLCHTKSDD